VLKKERHAYILHQVNFHNKVLSSSLSAGTHVSNDTIPRDLQGMADEGKGIKADGVSLSHSSIQLSILTDPAFHTITPIDKEYNVIDYDAETARLKKALMNFSIKQTYLLTANTIKTFKRMQTCKTETTNNLFSNLTANHLSLKPFQTPALMCYN
jgi:DeoR/GlpR family transcriptional regulator of sugar metabolism